MARTISDEDIRLNIIVNGNPAQKQLLDLEKSTRKLTKETDALRIEKKKLEAQGKKNSTEWHALTATIKTNTATIDNNKATMKQLQSQIGITGLTMNQLKQRASVLRLALNNMVPGSADSIRYNNELGKISARLTELKLKGRETKISLSSIANGFNKYAALGASAIAATTGVVLGMQKMIDYNGKLSDAQSDVQKTTGLTKDEVDALTKSFGILNTRTSRMDLLKIAEEGGRIGIAKDEIQDFVRVMNKANVALGDSFEGGPEEVASKLGKLKLLFKETKDIGVDKAYESIGSAINELGANGVATEANIADFATRLGSLSDNLKPTIQDALGLGAAFEESGIGAEIAGRAYSIFLGEAAEKSSKFAKVMGISTQEVEDLINTNPTEFFLQFSQKLNETSKKGTDTAKTLADLGLSADGVKKIVGAAGNNFERFRKLLDLSNTSMVQATSLTDEYNIKNNNLAANIEKIQKKMMALFSSEFIINGLGSFVNWFAKFIGVTEDSDGSVTNFRTKLIAFIKTVLIVTTGILSYKAALQLATFWTNRATIGTASYNLIQKATTLSTNILAGAVLVGQAVFLALTGQLKAARTAMIAFNVVTKLSPIGLLVGLVSAATVAYIAFSESAQKAATKQSLLNDAKAEASIKMVTERANLKLLLETANDENLSLERRQKAVDKLNELVPNYNKNLTIQTANTLAATSVLDDFIAAKEREILASIFLEDWKKKLEAQQTAENTSLTENIELHEHLWNTLKNLGDKTGTAADNVKTATENRKEHIDVLKEETKRALELYKAQVSINDNADANNKNKDFGKPKEGDVKFFNGQKFIFQGGDWVAVEDPKGKGNGGGTGGGSGGSTDKEKYDQQDITDFINKQRLQRINDAKNSLEKELAVIDERYQKEIDKANENHLSTTDLEAERDLEKQELKLQRQQEFREKLLEIEANEKLSEEEKEILKAEADFEKHTNDLLNLELTRLEETQLLERLEESERLALQKIRDKYRNKEQQAAQKDLEDKKRLNSEILDGAIGLVGQQTRLGQGLLAIKGIFAAKESLIELGLLKAKVAKNVAGATTDIAAGKAKTAAVGFPQNIPLLIGFAAQVAGIIGAIKSATSATQSVSATGYEKGLYNKSSFPVQREQDGKMFNAQFGGQTSSGMVSKPTVFMAGENGPELIVDSQAFKQINPDIKNSFMREIGRVKGFEAGLYQQKTFTDVANNDADISSGDNTTNLLLSEAINVIRENKELMQTLKDNGIIAYMSNDLRTAKKIKKSISDYDKLIAKNKR